MSKNGNTKKTSKQVLVLMPPAVVEAMDGLAKKLDLDRSKFVRQAVREKIAKAEAA